MLQITPQAEEHLIHLRVERGFNERDGVRFLTNAGGVGLTFTTSPDPDDRVVQGTNLPIYIAPNAVAALEEATIDAKTEEGKTVLVIRRQRRPGEQGPSNGS
jgi:Fe-S cluster assembly iron-binding protein IscA